MLLFVFFLLCANTLRVGHAFIQLKPMRQTGFGFCDGDVEVLCTPWYSTLKWSSHEQNRYFCVQNCQLRGYNTYTYSKRTRKGYCESKDAYLGFGARPLCTQLLHSEDSNQYQAYCPAGKYHSSTNGCTGCPLGRYNGVDVYSLNECYACDPGMYQDQKSQKQCKKCPFAKYQDSTAQEKCKACESGRYNYRTMRPSCDACPVGRFGTEPGVIHWQDGCTQCPSGFSQYQVGQTECNPCEKGYYTSSGGQVDCFACPDGYSQNQDGQTECEGCSPGKYAPDGGQESCNDCPEGRYQPGGAAVDCDYCKPGQYQPDAGKSSCTKCDAGKYQVKFGETSCSVCPNGKNSNAGAPSCCGAGMYTDSSAKCYQCAPGFFTPTSQRSVRNVQWYGDSNRLVEFYPRKQDTVQGAFFADDLVDVSTVQTFLPFTAPFELHNDAKVVVGGLLAHVTYELTIHIAESNTFYEVGSSREAGSQFMRLNLENIQRACVPGKDYTSNPSLPDATTYANPCVYTQCGATLDTDGPVGVIELTADAKGDIEVPLEYKIANTSEFKTCWCDPDTGDCQLGRGHDSTTGTSMPSGWVETTAGVRIHLKTKTVKCIKCPDDHYQDEVGQYECKSCPNGKFQNQIPVYHNYFKYAEVECTSCKKDHFGLDSSRCLPKSGWSQAGGSPAPYWWSTTPTYNHIYTIVDARSGETKREADPSGRVVEEASGMSWCTPGKQKMSNALEQCTVCPPGKFKWGDQVHDNTELYTTNTDQPKGYWQNFVPRFEPVCFDCDLNIGNCFRPQQCRMEFSEINWKFDYGAYALDMKAIFKMPCDEAPPGYFAVGSGNNFRDACPAGTYQDESGQSSCKKCKAGYYSGGSKDGQGYYETFDSNSEAITNFVRPSEAIAAACTACPAGKWSETFFSDAREWDAPETLVDTSSFAHPDGTTCPDKLIGRYTNSYVYDQNTKTCQYSTTSVAPETDAGIIESYFTNVGPGECLGLDGRTSAHGTVENIDSFTSARKKCYELPECVAFTHKGGQTFEFFCNSVSATCDQSSEDINAYRTLVGNLRAQIDGDRCPDGYIADGSTCVFLGQNLFFNNETNACHAIRARMHALESGGCHAEYMESCNSGRSFSTHETLGQCVTFAIEVCGQWVGGVPSSESICVHCPRGYFSETIGAIYRSTCRLCPAGYFSNDGGSGECTVCPKGTYSAVIGSGSAGACIACPVGKYQDEYARTVPEDCKLCAEGRFNTLERMPNIFACVECPHGYYQSSTESTTCHKCDSDNAITEQIGSTGEKDCKECPVGKFAAAKTCIMCPKGWKISSEGCQQCPVGKRSSAPDASECSDCVYQDESGQYKCKVCPTSHYVTNNLCTKCPEGFFAETINSDECVSCPLGKYASNKYLTSVAECASCPLVNYPSCYGEHVPITLNTARYSAEELCKSAASLLLNKKFTRISAVNTPDMPYGCFTDSRTTLYHNTHVNAPRQFVNPKHEGFCLHNMAPMRARGGTCDGVSGGPLMLQRDNRLFGGAMYTLAEIDRQRTFPWHPLETKVDGMCVKGEYGESSGCGTCPSGKYNHVYEKEQAYRQIKTYMGATRLGSVHEYMYTSDSVPTRTGANGPYGVLEIDWGDSRSGWLSNSEQHTEFAGVDFNDFTEESCVNICQHDADCLAASWAPAYIEGAYVEKYKDTAEIWSIDGLKTWSLAAIGSQHSYIWADPTLDDIRSGIWGTPVPNSSVWISTEYAEIMPVLSATNTFIRASANDLSRPLVSTIASKWWSTMHRTSTEPVDEWLSLERNIRNILPDGRYSNYMVPRIFFSRDASNPSNMSPLNHGSCFVTKEKTAAQSRVSVIYEKAAGTRTREYMIHGLEPLSSYHLEWEALSGEPYGSLEELHVGGVSLEVCNPSVEPYECEFKKCSNALNEVTSDAAGRLSVTVKRGPRAMTDICTCEHGIMYGKCEDKRLENPGELVQAALRFTLTDANQNRAGYCESVEGGDHAGFCGSDQGIEYAESFSSTMGYYRLRGDLNCPSGYYPSCGSDSQWWRSPICFCSKPPQTCSRPFTSGWPQKTGFITYVESGWRFSNGVSKYVPSKDVECPQDYSVVCKMTTENCFCSREKSDCLRRGYTWNPDPRNKVSSETSRSISPGFWLSCQRYGQTIRVDDAAGLACRAHLVHSFVKTKCTNCPVGKYSGPYELSDYTSSTYGTGIGVSACHECPNGWSSSGGAHWCYKCNECQPGHILTSDCHCETCPAGKTQSGTTCEACPAGKYSLEGASVCTECMPGRYSDTEGTGIACRACSCPAGQQITSASKNGHADRTACYQILCEPCPKGYAQNDLNPRAECIECGPHRYSEFIGTLTCTPCDVVCPSGYTRRTLGKKKLDECEPCSECSKGQFCSDVDRIERPCPRGTYQNQTGQTACNICPMGYYSYPGKEQCTECDRLKTSDEGAGFAEHCVLCSAGKFYSNPICVDCPTGWYSDIGDEKCCDGSCAPGHVRIGGVYENICDIDCSGCQIGYFCPDVTLQLKCDAGMYQDQPNQTECKSCPTGFFQSKWGQTDCDHCPVGRATPTLGAVTVDECVQCSSGTISRGEKACIACPAGTIPDSSQGKCVFSSQFRLNNVIDSKYNALQKIYYSKWTAITVPFASSGTSGYLEEYPPARGKEFLYVWESYERDKWGLYNIFEPKKRPFICPPGVYQPSTLSSINTMDQPKLEKAGWSNAVSGREGLANVWKFKSLVHHSESKLASGTFAPTGRGVCFKDEKILHSLTAEQCERTEYGGTWHKNGEYKMEYDAADLSNMYLSLETATEGMRYKNEPYLRCIRVNTEQKDEVGYCETSERKDRPDWPTQGWAWGQGADGLKFREDTTCEISGMTLSCRHERALATNTWSNNGRAMQVKFWEEKSMCRCSFPKKYCKTWVEGSIEQGSNSYKSKFVTGDDELGGILYARHFIPYITAPDTVATFSLGEVDPRVWSSFDSPFLGPFDLSDFPALIADDPCPVGYNFMLETLTCEGYNASIIPKQIL